MTAAMSTTRGPFRNLGMVLSTALTGAGTIALTLAGCGQTAAPVPAEGRDGQHGKPAAQHARVNADPAARPNRIVSLNVCADQLVLALADRDQIAGLTRYSADPQISAMAQHVKGLPLLSGSAEDVMVIGPDLVVGMAADRAGMLTGLDPRSYRTLDLVSANSFTQIVEQIRQVAQAVGHPERGEAMVAQMEHDLAALAAAAPSRQAHHGAVAAYYQRRGFLTGSGTLIDDLLTRSGLVNLAQKLGKPSLSQMTLEEMLAAQPDYIVTDSSGETVTDQGTEMLHHPLLRAIPRLHLPQAWTVCGGPTYIDAARSLAEQLGQAHTPVHRR